MVYIYYWNYLSHISECLVIFLSITKESHVYYIYTTQYLILVF